MDLQDHKPKIYRDFIDQMVYACNEGAGQLGASRIMNGVWNRNKPEHLDDFQNGLNNLLKRLEVQDRTLLAKLLAQTFSDGVFETIKVLEEFEIEPFETGYEGSPFNDFIGRLINDEDPWEWPE